MAEEFETRIRQSSTEDLLRMVGLERGDYRAEALALAEAELASRQALPPANPPEPAEPSQRAPVLGILLANLARQGVAWLGAKLLAALAVLAPEVVSADERGRIGWRVRLGLFGSAFRVGVALALLVLGSIDYSFLSGPGQNNVSGGLVVAVPILVLALTAAEATFAGLLSALSPPRIRRPWLLVGAALALVNLAAARSLSSELGFLRRPLVLSAVYALAISTRRRGNAVLFLPLALIAARLAIWGLSRALH